MKPMLASRLDTGPSEGAPDRGGERVAPSGAPHGWTFLSNHAHVLVCIARNQTSRVRDIAADVGLTERAVQRILSELEEGGVIQRARHGRRTSYTMNTAAPLRHPLEAEHTVGELISVLALPPRTPLASRPVSGQRPSSAPRLAPADAPSSGTSPRRNGPTQRGGHSAAGARRSRRSAPEATAERSRPRSTSR
jgi:hypothetical protein